MSVIDIDTFDRDTEASLFETLDPSAKDYLWPESIRVRLMNVNCGRIALASEHDPADEFDDRSGQDQLPFGD